MTGYKESRIAVGSPALFVGGGVRFHFVEEEDGVAVAQCLFRGLVSRRETAFHQCRISVVIGNVADEHVTAGGDGQQERAAAILLVVGAEHTVPFVIQVGGGIFRSRDEHADVMGGEKRGRAQIVGRAAVERAFARTFLFRQPVLEIYGDVFVVFGVMDIESGHAVKPIGGEVDVLLVVGEVGLQPQGIPIVFIILEKPFPYLEIRVCDEDAAERLSDSRQSSYVRDKGQEELSVGCSLDVPRHDGQRFLFLIGSCAAVVEEDGAACVVCHVDVFSIHREALEVLVFPFAVPGAVDNECHCPVVVEGCDLAAAEVAGVNQAVPEIHLVDVPQGRLLRGLQGQVDDRVHPFVDRLAGFFGKMQGLCKFQSAFP